MSRHERVSCDSCLRSDFRGKRYKCLICYDYDLCATCYEAGATTTRHTTDHAMQCILTRTDFELYYGGEALTPEQPQSFSCPYCGRTGYTETSLQEHVTSEHAEPSIEVVCPVCAALPGGDPNHVTEDFAAHLTLEHTSSSRDFEESNIGNIRQHVRRMQHPGPPPGRGGGGVRTTRQRNMQFQMGGSGAFTGLSPSSNRETMDPIAELLNQLTIVRNRAAAPQSVSSQLQQLEMQLQSTRQQLERLPRRQDAIKPPTPQSGLGASAANAQAAAMDYAGALMNTGLSGRPNVDSQYLLSRCFDPELSESEKQHLESERVDRSLYMQELLLSTLSQSLRLSDSSDNDSSEDEEARGRKERKEDDSSKSSTSEESAQISASESKAKDLENRSSLDISGAGGGAISGRSQEDEAPPPSRPSHPYMENGAELSDIPVVNYASAPPPPTIGPRPPPNVGRPRVKLLDGSRNVEREREQASSVKH